MKLLLIMAFVCVGLLMIGVAVNAISVEDTPDTNSQSCGSSCGNSCTAQNNCGLSTCGATQGKSCGCGR